MRLTMRFAVVLTLVLLTMTTAVKATCPDLMAKAPVREYAHHAQLVFKGRVIEYLPDDQDTAKTSPDLQQSVTFWVEAVYKGAGRLSMTLGGPRDALDLSDKLVNVSAWGVCPPKSQRSLIVFARWDHNSDGKLVADAPAVPWTEESEVEAWTGAGWDLWGEWSACSVSCGGGHQERYRRCAESSTSSGGSKGEDFTGDYVGQRRRCNMFSCTSVAMPLVGHGYYEGLSGRRAGDSAHLWVPLEHLFPGGMPKELALMLTLRLRPQNSREGSSVKRDTVLSIRTPLRSQAYLSLETGKHALRLVHSPGGDTGDEGAEWLTEAVEVSAPLGDGHWHHIAIGLQGNTLHNFVDCEWVSTEVLRRGALKIPVNADIVMGYLFQGGVAELTIASSSEAAAQQCHSRSVPLRGAPATPHSQHTQSQTQETNYQSLPVLKSLQLAHHTEQTARAQKGNIFNKHKRYYDRGRRNDKMDEVKERKIEKPRRFKMKKATLAICRKPCRFGGRCVAPDICACPPLARGDYCEIFTCYPACVNGGACVGPGQCECPHNATGRACEKPVCDPPCAAGGVCSRGNRCMCAPGARGPRCETNRRSNVLTVWAMANDNDLRLLGMPSSSNGDGEGKRGVD